MLKFEGDKDFPQEPALLWPKLRDAAFLVGCIPDATVEGQPTRDEGKVTVRPGFSFVRGSLDVDVRIVEAQEPTNVKINLKSKGVGSGSDVDVTLLLTTQANGTHLHWSAEVTALTGLLKMVPTGLIRGAGQKAIDDLWQRVGEKLSE